MKWLKVAAIIVWLGSVLLPLYLAFTATTASWAVLYMCFLSCPLVTLLPLLELLGEDFD